MPRASSSVTARACAGLSAGATQTFMTPSTGAIQLNDVLVGPDGLIYVTDRFAGGLYILELEAGAEAARPVPSARSAVAAPTS